MKDKTIDNDYKLVPMHEIEPEAYEIAVRWVNNHEPDGSLMQIEAKHKLASDIMNYARRFAEGKLKQKIKREAERNHNYHRTGGDLGPTGHGDTCMSDADPGF